MTGIEIRGQMIDVYRKLRDIAWMYPGMTLFRFLQLKESEQIVWEQLVEIASEIKKGKGEGNGKDL